MPAAPDDGLRVEILGPLRCWWNGAEIALGSPRRRAVFAALALGAGRVVPRDELIRDVWGANRPASVEGNLHTYVSGLRRALAPVRSVRWPGGPLVSESGGYAIRVEAGVLDAVEFERHCADADRQADAGDHRAVIASVDDALGLWRGEALSGVPGPFAEQVRARLAQLRLTAAERRARALLATGGHRELCAELTGLVGEHPLSESLRELLMLALYRSGRHSEALETFRDGRRALVTELGVEPGPDLARLHEQMLAFDPALAAPSDPAGEPPAAAAPPETDAPAADVSADPATVTTRVRRLVQDVLAGKGNAVWVEGPQDSGKTRLLTAALAGVEQAGARLVMATCAEQDGGAALLELYEGVEGRGPTVEEPSADTERSLTGALVGAVAAQCTRTPLVLVLDGLQWADDTTLKSWAALVVAAGRLPLLVVAGCRPVSERGALLWLRRRVDAAGGLVVSLERDSVTDTAAAPLETVTGNDVPAPRADQLAALSTPDPWTTADMLERALAAGSEEDPHRDAVLRTLVDVLDRLADGPAVPPGAHGDEGALPMWRTRQRRIPAVFEEQPGPEAAVRRSAYTLQTVARLCSRHHDHTRALHYLEQAVAAVAGHTGLARMHVGLLADRAVVEQRLDQFDRAGESLATAGELASGHAIPLPRRITAGYYYWSGQWQEFAREPVPAPALTDAVTRPVAVDQAEDVAALVSVRREDGDGAVRVAAAEQRRAEGARSGYLLAARAALAEQSGDQAGALRALYPVLRLAAAGSGSAYPWLPWLVRLAIAVGAWELAEEAARRCTAEARLRARQGGVAAAADWCRGLVHRDPAAVGRAAAHYREAGRLPQRAAALEDAAVLLADAGERGRASAALDEAVAIFDGLGARWDARRAMSRHAAPSGANARPERGNGRWVQANFPVNTGFREQPKMSRRSIQTHVASVLNRLEGPARPGAADEDDRRAQDPSQGSQGS